MPMREPESILSRYLDPATLGSLASRGFDPRGLVASTQAGEHASLRAGFAVEFSGHRQYVPGDDPRYIDWRVYFNQQKLLVKQFQQESDCTCHLVLDASGSMDYGPGESHKFRAGSRLVAALAWWIVRRRDKVGLVTSAAGHDEHIHPAGSHAQVVRICEHLDGLQPAGATRLHEVLSDLAITRGRRGVMLVVSDFFLDLDELRSALAQLRYQQHSCVLLQIVHSDERSFPFHGVVRFEGLESAEVCLATAADLLPEYQQALALHQQRLLDLCSQYEIEHVLFDTSRPQSEVLIDYLNHRSRLNRGR